MKTSLCLSDRHQAILQKDAANAISKLPCPQQKWCLEEPAETATGQPDLCGASCVTAQACRTALPNARYRFRGMHATAAPLTAHRGNGAAPLRPLSELWEPRPLRAQLRSTATATRASRAAETRPQGSGADRSEGGGELSLTGASRGTTGGRARPKRPSPRAAADAIQRHRASAGGAACRAGRRRNAELPPTSLRGRGGERERGGWAFAVGWCHARMGAGGELRDGKFSASRLLRVLGYTPPLAAASNRVPPHPLLLPSPSPRSFFGSRRSGTFCAANGRAASAGSAPGSAGRRSARRPCPSPTEGGSRGRPGGVQSDGARWGCVEGRSSARGEPRCPELGCAARRAPDGGRSAEPGWHDVGGRGARTPWAWLTWAAQPPPRPRPSNESAKERPLSRPARGLSTASRPPVRVRERSATCPPSSKQLPREGEGTFSLSPHAPSPAGGRYSLLSPWGDARWQPWIRAHARARSPRSQHRVGDRGQDRFDGWAGSVATLPPPPPGQARGGGRSPLLSGVSRCRAPPAARAAEGGQSGRAGGGGGSDGRAGARAPRPSRWRGAFLPEERRRPEGPSDRERRRSQHRAPLRYENVAPLFPPRRRLFPVTVPRLYLFRVPFASRSADAL